MLRIINKIIIYPKLSFQIIKKILREHQKTKQDQQNKTKIRK
jgi:hypothetical protein